MPREEWRMRAVWYLIPNVQKVMLTVEMSKREKRVWAKRDEFLQLHVEETQMPNTNAIEEP
jgi:hypothetical protein